MELQATGHKKCLVSPVDFLYTVTEPSIVYVLYTFLCVCVCVCFISPRPSCRKLRQIASASITETQEFESEGAGISMDLDFSGLLAQPAEAVPDKRTLTQT